ncbi:uncharacterized protein B0I36DRAFT_332398 [Microdochium trichocladiopsis]|uniref:Uncharacterized protein n=1 Tax=Microdochium trichocladiopsis TaxID=1682393 RepID=A0A9P8Y1B6_9PEZI|nr:uncharacterized protein B0I36DRAFT_332398 [Microdochium trichocladiopsis]KAH7025012.1 hypothetical protein B0I36DRAFT_332398 [Microdochium trichocladiopsis]
MSDTMPEETSNGRYDTIASRKLWDDIGAPTGADRILSIDFIGLTVPIRLSLRLSQLPTTMYMRKGRTRAFCSRARRPNSWAMNARSAAQRGDSSLGLDEFRMRTKAALPRTHHDKTCTTIPTAAIIWSHGHSYWHPETTPGLSQCLHSQSGHHWRPDRPPEIG